MKHFLIFVTFLSLAGKSFAVDYDSALHVVSDRSKPFDVRYETLMQHFYFFPAHQHIELAKTMEAMIPEAKQFTDKTQVIHLYGNLLRLCLTDIVARETAKLYLDSAMMYENHASDLGKAMLYSSAGYYYSDLAETSDEYDPLMLDYYYKAISCYEKVGGYYDERVNALHSIAACYYNGDEDVNFIEIVEKMKPLAKQANTFKSNLYTYQMTGFYYVTMYYEDEKQTHYLDSAVSCFSRIIRQYENLKDPSPFLAANVASAYLHFADYSMEMEGADFEQVIRHAEKALKIAPNDEWIKNAYYLTLAGCYLKQGKLDSALENALEALRLSEQDMSLNMKIAALALLSEIHELRKEFEQALEYEKLCSELQFNEYAIKRSQAFQNLAIRYEVAQKEENIRHLTEQNRYRENINRLYLGMLVLIVLVCIFGFLWFRGKRKADADKLQMTKLQSYLEGLESERSRLAKELHDQVSNGLASLLHKMQSSGVSNELTAITNNLQQQVRDISHDLIPPVFQHASLLEIIIDYVVEQNGQDGPCFQFFFESEEGWDKLPHQAALDLYRIVQESCSNAVKHAFAKNVTILLSRKENAIVLSITDDGQGFQTAAAKKGIGMQTIKERAANLNGTVSIESTPGKGTTVLVTYNNRLKVPLYALC